MPKPKEDLETRVVRAAEAALYRQQYVSAIDVLCGIGLLASIHVDSWRKGRVDVLEQCIQANPKKVSSSLAIFRDWAHQKGLKPAETAYVRATRAGTTPLQFTHAANPETEKKYRTHYISASLPEPKRQQLENKLNQTPRPVVFEIVRDAQCAECGTNLDQGSFLFMEADLPLCLACAALADLEYLPAGDTALTRRATRHSERVAVVVRFSRARKRYERQGILVETAALERAERECVEDAADRATQRLRAAEQRRQQDGALVLQMTQQIGILFPGCPPPERAAIAEHTAVRGSGRVGRTLAGRALEPTALTAAVVAAVRHRHTNYDALLAEGIERTRARDQVAPAIDAILTAWRAAEPGRGAGKPSSEV